MAITLRRFSNANLSTPVTALWPLNEVAESRGRQELFTKQAPQKLKVLREHALVESAVSSNRIEGVTVDAARVATVVFGHSLLRDRDEEEVRGYRQALAVIHEKGAKLSLTEAAVREMHRMTRGQIWDAGKYKEKDGGIIEKYADGRPERVRFRTEPAATTPAAMKDLLDTWGECLREKWVPPLIALAVFNLDFLCIHPFRDGNGRVSRLLLVQQCFQLGYEVGRYISLERLIEENKQNYYETLERSSQGWHEGKNDPWPYVKFVLSVLRSAYREFEQRVGQLAEPKGAKTDQVQHVVQGFNRAFTLAELEHASPAVSREMVRRVLRDMQKDGDVECVGRGPGAQWRRTARAIVEGLIANVANDIMDDNETITGLMAETNANSWSINEATVSSAEYVDDDTIEFEAHVRIAGEQRAKHQAAGRTLTFTLRGKMVKMNGWVLESYDVTDAHVPSGIGKGTRHSNNSGVRGRTDRS